MRLNFTHRLSAAAIRIQHLRKERPKGVLLTEQSTAAKATPAVLIEMPRRNQSLETRAQLTQRMASDPRLLVGPFLAAECGLRRSV